MNITIRQAEESDLRELDRIFRLAFATHLRLPELPMGDAEILYNRWCADPEGALAAEVDGRLAGSNFLARWGTFGFFGPLTVLPEYWGSGVGKKLLEATVERFAAWKLTRTGLYTFPDSPKHVSLYQKFGYWPGFLTMMLAKPLSSEPGNEEFQCYSEARGQEAVARQLASMTDRIYPGLTVSSEVRHVQQRRLGDTVLVYRGAALQGFAVCHAGPGSEAGSGVCYLKFAAALTESGFARLLRACEAYACRAGAQRLRAGVNSGRLTAYRAMLAAGYRPTQQGVAMERGDGAGFNRPGVFVLDDWQ